CGIGRHDRHLESEGLRADGRESGLEWVAREEGRQHLRRELGQRKAGVRYGVGDRLWQIKPAIRRGAVADRLAQPGRRRPPARTEEVHNSTRTPADSTGAR